MISVHKVDLPVHGCPIKAVVVPEANTGRAFASAPIVRLIDNKVYRDRY